jgi:hypothetical protein
MQVIELEAQGIILNLWDKGCPLDILCDVVDLEPEVIAEFLRAEGFVV